MNDQDAFGDSSLPDAQHLRIVRACVRFDEAWASGDCPRIEEFLADAPDEDHRPLLKRLLLIELYYRRFRRRETPTRADYFARFGGLADVIDSAFLEETQNAPGPEIAQVDTIIDPEMNVSGPGDTVDTDTLPILPPDGALDTTVTNPTGADDHGWVHGHSHHGGPRYLKRPPPKMGGIGVVWLAHDRVLGRDVALKELQDRFAHDADSLARFLLEAEITANLQHPGIIPVYDRGWHDGGRPFYVMRYIDDGTFRDAIDRYHAAAPPAPNTPPALVLTLPQLLRRFVDLCETIAFAHARDVLHRDIKPQNVMLGKFGETLVFDWGFAKVVRRDGGEAPIGAADTTYADDGPALPLPKALELLEPTQNKVMGTPHYMSPEQAAGKIAELTKRSDVYSLGATLYYLLTGLPAFQGRTGPEIIVKVLEGKFPPPREVKAGIARALEAVCLKAMQYRTEDRYESAKALAADIEHWLADEPVSCYRDRPPARALRWVRRHRPLAASAAVLLVVSSAALAVNNVLVRAEVVKTDAALKVADAARKQAEKDFSFALGVQDHMFRKLGDERLAEVPKMEQLRVELASTATSFAEKILDGRRSEPRALRVATMSYRSAANLLRLIGQYDRADSVYHRALDLAETIASMPDAGPLHRALRDQIATDYAEALRMGGRQTQAIQVYRDVLARGRANPLDREEIAPRYALARVKYNLGNALLEAGKYPEAKGLCDDAVGILEALAKANPRSPEFTLIISIPLRDLGTIACETGDPLEAKKFFARAHAKLGELSEPLSQAQEFQSNIESLTATILIEQGRLPTSDPGSLAEAREALDEAVRLTTVLTERFEGIRHYQLARASALLTRAELLDTDGKTLADPDLAKKHADDARKILEALPARPQVEASVSHLSGRAHGLLGRLAASRGERKLAESLLRLAIKDQQEALKAVASSPANLRAIDNHREALRALTQSP